MEMTILVQAAPDSQPIDLGPVGDYTLLSSAWGFTLRADLKRTTKADQLFAETYNGTKVHAVIARERDHVGTTLPQAFLKFSIRHDCIVFLASADHREITLN